MKNQQNSEKMQDNNYNSKYYVIRNTGKEEEQYNEDDFNQIPQTQTSFKSSKKLQQKPSKPSLESMTKKLSSKELNEQQGGQNTPSNNKFNRESSSQLQSRNTQREAMSNSRFDLQRESNPQLFGEGRIGEYGEEEENIICARQLSFPFSLIKISKYESNKKVKLTKVNQADYVTLNIRKSIATFNKPKLQLIIIISSFDLLCMRGLMQYFNKGDIVAGSKQVSQTQMYILVFSWAISLMDQEQKRYILIQLLFEVIFFNVSCDNKNEQLLQKGVTHILNVTAQEYKKRTKYFKYMNIDVYNKSDEDIKKHFRITNRFIKDCLIAGGKVFIHDINGTNIGPCFCFAYLINNQKIPLKTGFDLLQEKYELQIAPNFFKQLERYDLEKLALVTIKKKTD